MDDEERLIRTYLDEHPCECGSISIITAVKYSCPLQYRVECRNCGRIGMVRNNTGGIRVIGEDGREIIRPPDIEFVLR